MSILENSSRNGNFTSSKIWALTKKDRSGKGFGAPALTYIEECNMERRLGRSLSCEVTARPIQWGKLLERLAFEGLGFDYNLTSDITFDHPDIPYWRGSPDGDAPDLIFDIKCPMTLKSFCQMVDPIYDGMAGIDAINHIRENSQDGEKYYWQLVSNSIIKGTKDAELIVFMPYRSQLSEIKLMADGIPGCYWIENADEYDLPYIKDGGFYKSLNQIRFEVPESDKDLLTNCVIDAGKLLRSV